MGFFQQSKPQMVVRHLGKEDVVQKADRDRRLEPQVIFAFMQLSLVELAAVVQDALFVVAIGQHLHLDIELPAGLIACIEVQDGQLVVERLLGIKRIEQLELQDVKAGGRIQDTVHDADEDGTRRLSAQQVLEGVVYRGIDAQNHESLATVADGDKPGWEEPFHSFTARLYFPAAAAAPTGRRADY